MAEVLLYCWQFHKQVWLSAYSVGMIILFIGKQTEDEARRIVSMVITNDDAASRICKNICRDLVHKRVVDDECHQYLIFLSVLLRASPAFAKARRGKSDYFRSVGIACQRQLCSGKDNDLELLILEEGFGAIE